MPSIPLAWNASVACPVSSSASMRSPSSSARPDSLSPQVLSTRERIMRLSPIRALRSGRMVPSIMMRISLGTPGTAYITLSPTGQTSPGAVPGIWGMVEAPTGTSAWRRLFADIVRPRASKRRWISAAMPSSRAMPPPMMWAITSRVMSSCVGPRPPQQMTASERSSAVRIELSMRSKLSPTLTWKCESMPLRASCSPIHDEFVSVMMPSSSSVPMATTSQRT